MSGNKLKPFDALPEPDLEDHPYELRGQNVVGDFYSVGTVGSFLQKVYEHYEAQMGATSDEGGTPRCAEIGRLRAALGRIADPRNTHFAGDAQVVAREALVERKAGILLSGMGGAGVTVMLAQPVALEWGAPEIAPTIDAASIAPAAETFMHAVPEPRPVDMLAVCGALGFDPTNHHNAEKCPYCRSAPRHTAAMLAEHMRLVDSMFGGTPLNWWLNDARNKVEVSAKRMLGLP